MRTEQLIADLAARATPIHPLPPPGKRAIAWFALASAFAAAGLWIFGARPDLTLRLQQPDFLGTAILALAGAILTVVVALVLAIPGAGHTRLLLLAAGAVLGVWTTTVSWAVVRAGGGIPIVADSHWPACFARVVVVAFVPAIVLFAMVRRGLPLRLGWTAAVAAAAAASIGALVAQFACPLDDVGHTFLGHFVPVLVLGAVGTLAQGTLSRRNTA